MSAIERIDSLTLEEFVERYNRQPFELVNGEIRPIMPNVALHQLIVRTLFRLLDHFCTTHQLGEVVFEAPFVEVYGSTWVKGSRTPDLMFFTAAKWAQYVAAMDNWEKMPFVVVPDLAIEVVSPNDNYSDIEEKVDEYLEKGVALIWLIDPQRQRVTVYQGERYVRLGIDGTLDGGDVLPGFELAVPDIFKV